MFKCQNGGGEYTLNKPKYRKDKCFKQSCLWFNTVTVTYPTKKLNLYLYFENYNPLSL